MNEELDPFGRLVPSHDRPIQERGLPERASPARGSQESPSQKLNERGTLGEFVAQHPMLSIAACAAVGAGAMAVMSASRRRGEPGEQPGVNGQAVDAYAELRSQLGKLVEQLNASLPSTEAMAKTASDFGKEAAKVIDKASDAAKQTFRSSATAQARPADEASTGHPVIKSLVLGALGTWVASRAAAAKAGASANATSNASPKSVANGRDTASTASAASPQVESITSPWSGADRTF